MTEITALNRNWEFTDHYDDAFREGSGVFPTVELPHTCAVTPYHYFDESVYQMLCGYRRRLPIPAAWTGKRVFLHIGAAGHSAEVYVNGQKLAEHRCGYTAFQTELTDAVTPGQEALIVIRVDTREDQDIPPFGKMIDYMTYGGLYREVWLEVHDPAFIEDVFPQTRIDPERQTGRLSCEISLAGLDGGASYTLRQTVSPAQRPDIIAAREEIPVKDCSLSLNLDCGRVGLWSPDTPDLYLVKTELFRNGRPADVNTTRFGFRQAEFRPDGFYLNGMKTKLLGLNRHQSWPYIGYAAPRSLQRLDAELLKYELGVNAVRTSHYPQSPHFIDRCDELGLMVFTEIPGWQHIGGKDWKRQAIRNTEDMVLQYRNHPSVILWGVRINESLDNDALYRETNRAAHTLDPTRPTGGVRYLKRSSLLEDVYTYNDFLHDGKTPGCEKKKNVTPNMTKGYLISEYNGHMFPTKPFDDEEHRTEHALRHANVLDAAAAQEDIAGSFGWCMFDYNTHRDFGSGDRICYHGVMDMFRNKKLAADVYAVHQDQTPVLSVSSSMDIGEHPASNRGRTYIFTNADSVRFYKNHDFIAEFTHKNTPYRHLSRPPIEIEDFIGGQLEREEGFSPAQARFVRDVLNHSARFGYSLLSPKILLKAVWLMLRYRMTWRDAMALYQKYIGNWGDAAKQYRFEAVKDGEVVKTVVKAPADSLTLSAEADHTALTEGDTYDMALVRVRMTDQFGNTLPFYAGSVKLSVEGPIEIIGPEAATLRGGMSGAFVKTVGKPGKAVLTLTPARAEPVRIEFTVTKEDV